MTLWLLLFAALLLSVERLVYVWASCAPESFRAWCTRFPLTSSLSPIKVLWKLFYGFKVLQFVVFIGWCVWHQQWAPSLFGEAPVPLAVGSALLVIGQALNLGVFYRLGVTGVFYGNRFGEQVPWCRKFPFSLCRHPQYLGTLCSIWGFFVAVRFPHDDWYLLPALETLYYACGAYLEP
jgi:methylene-fatty-acyl-phospholipid synthase